MKIPSEISALLGQQTVVQKAKLMLSKKNHNFQDKTHTTIFLMYKYNHHNDYSEFSKRVILCSNSLVSFCKRSIVNLACLSSLAKASLGDFGSTSKINFSL